MVQAASPTYPEAPLSKSRARQRETIGEGGNQDLSVAIQEGHLGPDQLKRTLAG